MAARYNNVLDAVEMARREKSLEALLGRLDEIDTEAEFEALVDSEPNVLSDEMLEMLEPLAASEAFRAVD